MKNKEKYSLKTEFMVLLFGLMISFIILPTTNAFANTFLIDKTMELYKGETGKYCIYLQNTGEEDLTQIIKIFDGEEYIRNLDEIKNEFNVPVGTVSDDLPVCMKVKLPRDAEKGEKYMVSYGITSPTSNDREGMVSFAPVQIREKFYLTERLEKREDNPYIVYMPLVLAAILILIAIGYMYYRKAAKRKAKK